MKNYLVAGVCWLSLSIWIDSTKAVAQTANDEVERLREKIRQVTSLEAVGYKTQFFFKDKSKSIPREVLLGSSGAFP